MSDLRDVIDKRRYEQGFADADGTVRCVWADYADRGDARAILHVEAELELRGTGASGRFMQSLAGRREQTAEILCLRMCRRLVPASSGPGGRSGLAPL